MYISLSPRLIVAASVICTSLMSASLSAATTSQKEVPISFRDGETHLRSLDNVSGTAIAEGDIILGDADKFFLSTNKRTTRGANNASYGAVWPNGLVPYQLSSQLSDIATNRVQAAVARWNQTGAITLIERSPDNAAAHPDFIEFVASEQCASWVGYQNAGAQSIFTSDKCSEGSMVHELGHAIGLLHEHTRPDRDNYIQINWESISAAKVHNFDLVPGSIASGDYDYASIMHYGSHYFSRDGNETITTIQTIDAPIGQRKLISAGDIAAVAALYESDLSVVAATPSQFAATTMELQLHISNGGDTAASSLILKTSVPTESKLLSSSPSSWVCSQISDGADIVCTTPALAKSANSTVLINLSTPINKERLLFDTSVEASTFDTDMTNNNDTAVVLTNSVEGTQSQPSLAAAHVSSVRYGGGSFSILGLLLFLFDRRIKKYASAFVISWLATS